MIKALELLQSPEGPVLEDFAEDAPRHGAEGGTPACPVDFKPHTEPLSQTDRLLAAFKEEFSQMQSWYDLARQKRGRTTAVTSESNVKALIDGITDFVKNGVFMGTDPKISQGTGLRMAVEDLKAYYLEAVSIQPGQPTDSKSLADWFWGRTAAAKVIAKIRKLCKESADDTLKRTTIALIPRNQLHRF